MLTIKLLRRRFPQSANRITAVLGLLSASALVLGIGMLFLG